VRIESGKKKKRRGKKRTRAWWSLSAAKATTNKGLFPAKEKGEEESDLRAEWGPFVWAEGLKEV